jgi:carbamoylphosphate synthase small subunit
MRHSLKKLTSKLERRNDLGNLDVDGRIILREIRKQGTGYIRLL